MAVYSEADRHSLHVAQAGESVSLGPAPAAASYLDIAKVLAAARTTGADAIHPGYGFLSENAEFAEACERSGIAFIGPTPPQMRAFGLKHTAREIARANGVPLLPGTSLLADAEEARAAAVAIGLPVMLKSVAGGGGIGMRLCRAESEVAEAFATVARTSQASFKDNGIYLEKFVDHARHLEVQIFGDGLGEVIALGERDCSVQRQESEGNRGDTCATAFASGSGAPSGKRRPAGESGELPFGGNGGIRLRRGNRRILFPRSQYPPAGGTRCYGGSHWSRSGRVDDSSVFRRYAAIGWPEARTSAGHSIQVRDLRCRRSWYELSAERGPPDRSHLLRRMHRIETWIERGTEVHSLLRPSASRRSSFAVRRGTKRWRTVTHGSTTTHVSPGSKPISATCARSPGARDSPKAESPRAS